MHAKGRSPNYYQLQGSQQELNSSTQQPHNLARTHIVHGKGEKRTLKQECYLGIQEAQCAFKVLMIHEVLRFALHIAFRRVLHRCGSLDIRC
mmetsp:Transcript_10500/g.15151  ORF Transcript_10500/g.15151 Transcript_10500/m.15151 type:complete len:92 (-) Transcript_10500:2585-2860(-)